MKTIGKYSSKDNTLIIRENSKGEYIGELYENDNVKRGQWISRATFEGKDATTYRVMEYFNFDQNAKQQPKAKKLKAIFDACTYSYNKRGTRMLTTRYSCWMIEEFDTKEEAHIFARGVVYGMAAKWSRPAVRVRFSDHTEEEITA